MASPGTLEKSSLKKRKIARKPHFQNRKIARKPHFRAILLLFGSFFFPFFPGELKAISGAILFPRNPLCSRRPGSTYKLPGSQKFSFKLSLSFCGISTEKTSKFKKKTLTGGRIDKPPCMQLINNNCLAVHQGFALSIRIGVTVWLNDLMSCVYA